MILIGEGETRAGMLGYKALLAQGEAEPDAGRGGDDLATLFCTGGTTGAPRASR